MNRLTIVLLLLAVGLGLLLINHDSGRTFGI
ncbi:TIGR02281 family clan AA aspartic protease, partial [Rhizobium sp. BR5]